MPRTMSATATQAVLSQYTDQVFLFLLEIDHEDLVEPIRLVGSREDIVSNGNTYTAFPFEITLPSDDGETISDIRLSISNIDRSITQTIRDMSTPPEITTFIVLADTPDDIEAGPFIMTLREAKYDAFTVSGSLRWENLLDQAYPGYTFTPAGFPGMF